MHRSCGISGCQMAYHCPLLSRMGPRIYRWYSAKIISRLCLKLSWRLPLLLSIWWNTPQRRRRISDCLEQLGGGQRCRCPSVAAAMWVWSASISTKAPLLGAKAWHTSQLYPTFCVLLTMSGQKKPSRKVLEPRALGPTWHPEKPWWTTAISSLPSRLVIHLSSGWMTPFLYKLSSISVYWRLLYVSLDSSEESVGW